MQTMNDKVAQQLIASTKELKANMWRGIRFYTGVLKDEENVWVLWHTMHGVDLDTSWELHLKALWKLFVDTANSIAGFEWRNEYISGNGGSDWFLINLTETTDEAWQQWLNHFERPFLNDSFMEMIADSEILQNMEQERQDEKLAEFWQQWTPHENYFLPEKYYKEQEFPGMAYLEQRFVWVIRDQKKFDAHAQALFLKALNKGDVGVLDAGELSITQCIHCKKWDFTDNTEDVGVSEYAHPECDRQHRKTVYPKKLL